MKNDPHQHKIDMLTWHEVRKYCPKLRIHMYTEGKYCPKLRIHMYTEGKYKHS